MVKAPPVPSLLTETFLVPGGMALGFLFPPVELSGTSLTGVLHSEEVRLPEWVSEVSPIFFFFFPPGVPAAGASALVAAAAATACWYSWTRGGAVSSVVSLDVCLHGRSRSGDMAGGEELRPQRGNGARACVSKGEKGVR